MKFPPAAGDSEEQWIGGGMAILKMCRIPLRVPLREV